VTITANDGNGHTASQSLTTNSDGIDSVVNLAISWTANTGGNTGTSGTGGSWNPATVTPSATPSNNVTVTPTTNATVTPTATTTITPTPTPTPTPGPNNGGFSTMDSFIAILVAAVVAVAFIAYFVLLRRR